MIMRGIFKMSTYKIRNKKTREIKLFDSIMAARIFANNNENWVYVGELKW